MITTIEIAEIAGRLGSGRATAEDIQMAERLLLALVALLSADSGISLP